MRSFLKEIEQKFIELESDLSDRDYDGDGELESPETEYKGSKDRAIKNAMDDDELDEMSTTGAVAGFNTPAAFAKPGKWRGKKARYESVNTPPTFKWNEEQYQRPESEEEEYNSKFPFAIDGKEWQHSEYEYPSKNLVGTPGIASKHKHIVEDVLERKYEQLIESYRNFATSDSKTTPEQKVKNTIKEVAKRLQEIETMVNYNSRLKTESGVTSSTYGNSTKKALSKISERLIKISERVRALGE